MNTSGNFYLLFILKAYNGLVSPNDTNPNIFYRCAHFIE